MYNLNDDQIASLLAFEAKIPESLVRSRVEKWLEEITPTQRVTAEQMEQFVALATHLPKELQSFPISFATSVKNTPETEKREDKGEVSEKANLTELVDESIEDVPDQEAADNEEEALHKLGTDPASTAGGKKTKKKTAKKSTKKDK